MAEAVRDAESTRENPDGLRPSVISWRCGPKDPTRQPARHAFCCMRKPERKAQVWRLRYPPREVSLVGQSLMPEKLADGDYGALLRCDWRRSPDGTESEWLPFTLDNSMLTPCSGGPNVTVSLAVHTLTLV